jgi:hypothetical protein
MKFQFANFVSASALVLALASVPTLADEAPAAPSTNAPMAPPVNPHKSYDKRFNACKAAARNSGVSAEGYQAFMTNCMKKGH